MNAGGFFFSSPIPAPQQQLHNGGDGSQNQQNSNGTGGLTMSVYGCNNNDPNLNMGAGMDFNASANMLAASMGSIGNQLNSMNNGGGNNQMMMMNQQQQQQQQQGLVMNVNNNMLNQQQGGLQQQGVMNNLQLNNNLSGSMNGGINLNNTVMNPSNNTMNGGNNMIAMGTNLNNLNMNNNILNSPANQGNVATVNINTGNPNVQNTSNTGGGGGGLGSFFFNPLAALFANSNNSNATNTSNNAASGNNNNTVKMASSSSITQRMLLNNNSSALGAFQHNQQQAALQQHQAQQQKVQQQHQISQQQAQQQQHQQQLNIQAQVQQQQQVTLQQQVNQQPQIQQVTQQQHLQQVQQPHLQQIQQQLAQEQLQGSVGGSIVNPVIQGGNTSGAPSPMPMTFMTPKQGPTPCPTPPTPMFHDANSVLPIPAADTNTTDAINNLTHAYNAALAEANQGSNQQATENSIAATTTQALQQKPQNDTIEAKSPQAPKAASLFSLKGMISKVMGSALGGAVATYVNQSFLSGIPFHIADRAMKETKDIYTKWWEQGLHDKNNGEKKRKGSTDEEDNADDSDEEGNNHQGKKIKLDVHEGSSLSKSLKKNYDDMGIDTSSKFIEYQQTEEAVYEQTELLSSSQFDEGENNVIEVDTSIIRPRARRSQFDQRRKRKKAEDEQEPIALMDDNAAKVDALFAPAAKKEKKEKADEANSSGYNAFNHFGGMYGYGADSDGESDDGNKKEKAKDKAVDQTALTYGSLGSYYTTNDDDDEQENDAAKSTAGQASAQSKTGSAVTTTITSQGSTTATDSTAAIAPTPLDGTMQVISELLEEKNRASEENEILQMISSPRDWVKKSIRSEMIESLQRVQGDVKDKRFLSSLEILSNFYKTSGRDARVSPWCGRRNADDPGVEGGSYGYSGSEIGGPTSSDLLEGNWVNMSRPNYIECLGQNGENDFMYTLGRMSFDMFQPGGLICSVQSTHNTIKIIGEREELPAFVPKSLKEEVASLCDSDSGDGSTSRPLLRSYDIAVSLTIEPPESVGQPEPDATPTPTKRMRAIMSVKGYVLPDPNTPNRLTVWFTGGQLSPARLASRTDGGETDDEDQAEYSQPQSSKTETLPEGYGGFDDWAAMFSKGKWRKTLGERARAMAAKLLLGADVPHKMEDDGHMEYHLHRPVGGHGKVYVDVLYLDEDILIMRGHHGTIYAMARSGVSQRYRAIRGNLASTHAQ